MKGYRGISFVLALAILLAVAPFGSALAVQAPDNLPTIEYSAAYEFNLAAEERIFELVNSLRQNPGAYKNSDGVVVSSLHPAVHTLTRSTVIKNIARYKSLHMAAYDDFSHNYNKGSLAGVGSAGTSELVFFDTVYWAENIAFRSTSASYSGREYGELLFYQWVNSPPHLAGMMSNKVNYIGVGVAAIRTNNITHVYGTQQFAFDSPGTSKKLPNPLTTGGNEGTIIGGSSGSTSPSVAGLSWQKSGDTWYLLNNTQKLTGWQQVNGKWFYLDPSTGAMCTGWQQIGSASGASRWYYFNGSGVMQTGWQQISGANGVSRWYYFFSNGAMATGWLNIGGKWYYLNGGGAMATGWVGVNGKWHYMDAAQGGAMRTGWMKLGGKWYYLDPTNGAMATGSRVINGTSYAFSSAGVWLQPSL